MSAPKVPGKPLWACPKCRAQFTAPNQWHSCGRFDLDALFTKSSPMVRRLYRRFVALVKSCGPVTILPQKSRVAFQVRMRFAAVMPQQSCLKGHLVLADPVRAACFERVESLSVRNHVHVFRLESEAQLTPELAAWVVKAYKIGRQDHLSRGPARRVPLTRPARARRRGPGR
jgi:hypothetical protein